MKLGEMIYQQRTKKNKCQSDVADLLEVSRQSVSKWENDSAVPELEKLRKMAELFDISLDELAGGQPAAPKEEPEPLWDWLRAGIVLVAGLIPLLLLWAVHAPQFLIHLSAIGYAIAACLALAFAIRSCILAAGRKRK